jgi:DNA-binding PadR family transcriptional regulator
MFKAHLTYSQLKQFLSSLLEKGLIEYHKEDRLYTITEKGIHFLQVYNQFNQLQKSNVFNTINEFEIIEPMQVADEHKSGQSNHLALCDE